MISLITVIYLQYYQRYLFTWELNQHIPGSGFTIYFGNYELTYDNISKIDLPEKLIQHIPGSLFLI